MSKAKNRVIDSPQKTLENLKAIKNLTRYLQRCSRNKDYNAGEVFGRLLKKIDEIEESVENEIDLWEEVMSEGEVIADYEW